MDVQSRKIELKSQVKCEESSHIVTKKRPFDVAFLMLPDEKLKQKHQNKLLCKSASFDKEIVNNNDEEDEDEEIDVIEDSGCELKFSRQNGFFAQKQQIFDDPNLIKNTKHFEGIDKVSSSEQKSAFTKVNLSAKEARVSPSLSLSPDINYQNSLSPSPPTRQQQYQNLFVPQNQIFKSVYQPNFMPENFPHPLENQFLAKNSDLIHHQQNFAKLRPTIYRPEIPYSNYPHHQFATNHDLLKITSPADQLNIRNPAAAILTSLLPPSLAALSLPGQNVCAKCNITFRMTSDLVYHMRSHHKNESNDMSKRRREEKLKCPVCAESFRERHHLTRHMTAHQDKDDDEKETKKDGV